MIYKEENEKLFNDIIDTFFLEKFKKSSFERHLEIILSPKCNLKCKYCYVNRYYDKIFNFKDGDQNKILNNLQVVLDWYTNNDFICNIEIFSGELFAQELGFLAMDMIYDHFKDKVKKPKKILIPSNFTFLHSDDLTIRVENIINKFSIIGIDVILSCSFDGLYCQKNRPKKEDLDIEIPFIQDNIFIEKMFRFCKKNQFLFHPMIYYDEIDSWIDNFNWFQDNFKKYDFEYNSLYLLAVRNDGWTRDKCIKLYDFIKYIIKDSWNHYEQDFNKYKKFLFEEPGNGLNLITSYLTDNSNGITCTVQSDLAIKVLDLSIYPCHRQIYQNMRLGTLQDNSFINCNPSLAASYWGYNKSTCFKCIDCPIKVNCGGQCLGSSYETNLNSFNPIDSVCRMQFYSTKAIVDGLKDIGIYDQILKYIPENVVYGLKYIDKMELL